MAIIVFNQKNNPLQREPYRTFNKLFAEAANNLEGARIEFEISGRNEKKDLHVCFCNLVEKYFNMAFTFSEVSMGEKERKWYIRYSCEFDIDSDDFEEHRESLENMRLKHITDYIYIDGVEGMNYSYYLGAEYAEMIFDILVDGRDVIQSVCCGMINYIIAVFATKY